MRKGILFVISGPSGAGKGTVMKEVFGAVDGLAYSVSATTRAPREGEIHGKNYFFVTDEEFDKAIENGEMLEHIEKFGNRYGTSKIFVEKLFSEGSDVVLEIETIGAENVKRLMPESVSIFILPPTLEVLWERLTGRHTETEEQAKTRFEIAKEEMKCAGKYDYVVINDDVKKCAEKIAEIIAEVRQLRG